MEQNPILRNPVDRREFTLKSALALLSGVAISLSACSSEDAPAGPTSPVADRTAVISSNHGHAAVVTGGQLTAAQELVLDIRGAADHPHTVALSRSEVEAIAAGRQVVKLSSTDLSHGHTTTFN
jgi:hypothetical protein